MNTRAELKRYAKDQLKGRWGLAIGGIFVAGFLIPIIFNLILRVVRESFGLSLIVFLVTIFVSAAIGVGICKFSLNYAERDSNPKFTDIFSGFSIIHKAVGLYILLTIIVTIGLFLVIVPGIIFIYMFSQSFFILADDNNKSIIECLKESSAIMKGHKFEYFVLTLSFLGWIILGMIPLCIGLLWVVPYMNVTVATYYLKLRDSYNNNDKIA
ncbi:MULTISPECIES: DUF975 family protein [Clostridium]|jgi:Predicted integral membrane protein|uniref:Membrane protein n=3 Tax=Clostridiaceae TaxID=31979 RepID=A0AAV3W099_9CLOT|nr:MULTISPECIES: DUF975 family protein [Clostridium]AQS06098.1 hypothetical protein CLBIJ_35410 [Clostridium beijerinckii]MBA2886134.1 putative membrane protein [Clostridium beijerinckii]MBA2901008.1 putative membrane protein [Clostridium beijerinckii]MBA2910693.1 putative membrane protein [Clostridium beijerinckii]MBA9014296.1 putative membrane protein [Clostridium beijerinckii]